MEKAIIINSSDSTAHYGKGWNWFFQHYWNTKCGIPVYFLTENEVVDYYGVTNIVLGKKPWRRFLEDALDMIDAEYVLFAMDDHMFLKPLPDTFLDEAFQFTKDRRLDRLGIYRKRHPKQISVRCKNFAGYEYRELTQRAMYLSCLQPSIWKVDSFFTVLRPGWSPWDMELSGTPRVRQLGGFNAAYVVVPGWYAEAYQMGKPRKGDFEILKSQYDWEVDDD